MTPPRELYRVEWNIAKRHDRPDVRTPQARNYTKPENAGAQIRRLRQWIPSHCELVGVWHTAGYADGLDWERIDPASLPVPALVAARVAVLEAANRGATVEQIGAMAEYMMINNDWMDEE